MLELENQSSHDVVFEVAIVEDGGETVFETKQAVAKDSAVAVDQPTDEPGQYSVHLTIDGQERTQNVSLFAKEGDSCVIAVGRLNQAERLRIEGRGYDDCTN